MKRRDAMWHVPHRNGGQMQVILNGEPLEEVNCFKYLGMHVTAMEDVKGMWYTE